MEQRLKNRIEPQLTALVDGAWEDTFVKKKLADIGVSPDVWVIIQQRIQIAYQDGRNDYHEEIKDIYLNDIDHFEEMFENDENDQD